MIVVFGKLSELPTDLFRRNSNGRLAVPAAGQHVFGKTRCEVGGQFRPLKRESMVGARDDDEGAIGYLHTQRILHLPRGEKIEFAAHDHGRGTYQAQP